MTEHRHDFWRSHGRKETNASQSHFPYRPLLRECHLGSQGEPARSRRCAQSPTERPQRPAAENSNELEFSDFGRDARFLPGWWIFPAFSFGLCILAGVVGLFV